MRLIFTAILLLSAAAVGRAEEFTVCTYNVENFREHFQGDTWSTTKPALPPELLARLRKEDDEDNWELAVTLTDPKVNPDLIVLQECGTQAQLEKFNKRWLGGAYETVVVFPSNTTRDQNLAMMLKPAFKILEKRDQYHLEPDPIPNPRGDRLFARGPVFCLIQTPGGYKFWLGTNHQKSKSGNNVEVTKWRTREAVRTNAIINELSRSSTPDVLFLGDMNDELGIQEFELEAGGDTIAALVGSGSAELFLATRKLAESGAISYGGYWDGRHRSFIDHILSTKSMQPKLSDPIVFTESLAKVSSDHYPVVIRVKTD